MRWRLLRIHRPSGSSISSVSAAAPCIIRSVRRVLPALPILASRSLTVSSSLRYSRDRPRKSSARLLAMRITPLASTITTPSREPSSASATRAWLCSRSTTCSPIMVPMSERIETMAPIRSPISSLRCTGGSPSSTPDAIWLAKRAAWPIGVLMRRYSIRAMKAAATTPAATPPKAMRTSWLTRFCTSLR